MFTYIRLPAGFWKWTKWTLLGISLLAVATYGFCYFLENYDPDYPWSGALGRSMKAKGVRVNKFQKDGAWHYGVAVLTNQQSPPSSLEWNEIEAIASLKRIDVLDIHGPGGPWVTSLLNAVRELEGTTSVRLTQVGLDDAAVDALNKFESLTYLSLLHVPEPGRVLARLNNRSIKDLSICSNLDDADLAGLNPELRLETLDLTANTQLTGENFDKIAALKTLKKLRLSHVGLEGDGLAHLKDHPTLELLSLSHTQLSGRDLREIAGNKALKALYVEGPFSANFALKAIGGMENLEILVLQNHRGTEQGLVYLKGAKKLKVLQVSVPVTEVGIRHLAELPSLEELRAIVRINRPVIRELATLKNLKQLDPIHHFPPGDTDLRQELRTANPQLSVNAGQWRLPN